MGARAGFWIRVAAALIDLVAAVVLAFAAGALVAVVWDHVGEDRAQYLGELVLYGGFLLYTSLEIWTAGTAGKLATGLRITRLDGGRADFWRLFLRWSTKHLWLIAILLFIVTAHPVCSVLAGFSSLVVAVGCLFAASDDHLAWHDQWAGTAVCRRRRADVQVTPPPPPPLPAA